MRLNLGSGPDVRPGWWSCDLDPYPGLDWQGDVLAGLPLADGCAEGAVSHHCLQMVAYPELVPWLAEVRRVLAPGAWLRLTLPDLLGAVEAWKREVHGDRPGPGREWFPISPDLEPSVDGALCLYLSQAGATRSVFTGWWARELCHRAGYQHSVWREQGAKPYTRGPAWLTEMDSRLGESIVVEAQA